jgi:integrase
MIAAAHTSRVSRTCASCGNEFQQPQQTKAAKYCGQRCRQAGWREKQKLIASLPPGATLPESPPAPMSSSSTLLEVFENHYRRDRLRFPPQNTLQKWRQAIRWFGESLGRLALVSDLSVENVNAADEYLEANCITRESRRKFRRHLKTLWWYLQEKKVLRNAPKRRKMPSKRTLDMPRWRRRLRADDWTGKPTMARPGPIQRRLVRGTIIVPKCEFETMTTGSKLVDLADWYIARRLRGCGPETPKKYYAAIDELEFLLNRESLVKDLTDETIEAVMYQVLDNGQSIPTANSYRAKYAALWNFAFRRGVLKTAPEVEKMVEPKRVPVGWTREQLATLWNACAQQKGMIGDVPAGLWLLAFHSCLWDSGERFSAMLSARWDRIDPSTRELVITAEFRKGKTEDKAHVLHPDTMLLLGQMLEPKRELIFPMHFSKSTLYKRYKATLKAHSLPHDRKRMFHCIRRSSASFLKAAGGDPTEFLGHSGPAVTKVYLVPSIVNLCPPSDRLFRPDGGRGARALIGVEGGAL